MMLVLRRTSSCPIDYSMCNQTVTVCRKEGANITATVHTNAFLDHKKTQSIDKTGSREANTFLLVIPGSEQKVFVGDKVLRGKGWPVSTREEWAALIPAKVPGLVVVSYADPKYWGNQMVHTEAGG